jgi:RNA polymerase sigma-70 factor (ECF subfamily)
MDDIAQRMDVNDALDRLPAQEREIVTLRVIGGLKFREISEVMDIPSGTAKWKYQKALGKLQNMIERD